MMEQFHRITIVCQHSVAIRLNENAARRQADVNLMHIHVQPPNRLYCFWLRCGVQNIGSGSKELRWPHWGLDSCRWQTPGYRAKLLCACMAVFDMKPRWDTKTNKKKQAPHLIQDQSGRIQRLERKDVAALNGFRLSPRLYNSHFTAFLTCVSLSLSSLASFTQVWADSLHSSASSISASKSGKLQQKHTDSCSL